MKPWNLVTALTLLAMLGCGGGSGLNSGTISIRTINFVRGTTAINVTADTGVLATNLAYGTTTAYGPLSSYPQQIFDKDPSTSASLGSLNLSATPGAFYTLYADGVEGGNPASTLTLFQDVPPAASTTQANVRFGNFSPAALTAVDVYITLTSNTAPLNTLSPNFSNIPFQSLSTSYVLLPGGSYQVRITSTGQYTLLCAPYALTLTNGTDYTVYAYDQSALTPALVSFTDTY